MRQILLAAVRGASPGVVEPVVLLVLDLLSLWNIAAQARLPYAWQKAAAGFRSQELVDTV